MINKCNFKDEKIFGKKVDGKTYVVREGIYGVVINEIGQVAVIKNAYGYFLPGGGIEEGENHQECLVREFLEETGYSIFIKDYIGKASKYYFSEAFNHYRHPVGDFYIVNLNQHITDLIEKDHELLWIEPSKCSNLLYEHQNWAVKQALTFR